MPRAQRGSPPPPPTRRMSLLILSAAGMLSAAGCRCAGGDEALVARIDAGLTAAARYVVSHQGPDGTWAPTSRGPRLDRPALTSHVLSCLFFLPPPGGPGSPAYRRGRAYLASLVDDAGRLAQGVKPAYPVYTAAEASRMAVLGDRSEANLRVQQAWLGVLSQFQYTEALGWHPGDPDYGGWGIGPTPPMKPGAPGGNGTWSYANLSTTIYGVAAYRSARAPTLQAVSAKALAFIERCQNFPDEPSQADPRFDDGGFFYCVSLPEMNKAGVAGTDAAGATRQNSYGSMTADGLRGLLACGLKPDHPRVVAARRWLLRHFSVTRHPGNFTSETEWMRDAFYYYWVWSLSHAMLHGRRRLVDTQDGPVDWPAALADALLARQRPDGSWANEADEAMEDDPLVSTAWAASALAICRAAMAPGEGGGDPCRPGRPAPHP